MKNTKINWVLGGIALLILPLVLQYFGNAWVRIADLALLYVMLALGLNIVVGYAGLLDLGYVAFYAVGAYLFGLMASMRPSKMPPTTAPARLPMPPNTAAVKALRPGRKPMVCCAVP